MSEQKPYSVLLLPRARDALKKIDKKTAERILKKILWLAQNGDTIAHEMLTGDWHGYYRYRVGGYRIIYLLNLEERVIRIVLIGHRREVYD